MLEHLTKVTKKSKGSWTWPTEYVEPVIFHFHRKPMWNLGAETELPVSTYIPLKMN